MLKGAKLIGTFGDVDPIKYGGGVFFQRDGRTWLEYTHGLDGGDSEDSMHVYRVDIEHALALPAESWAEFGRLLENAGVDPDDFADMADSNQKAALIAEMVGGYWGWENIDAYPLRIRPTALAERWGFDPADYYDTEKIEAMAAALAEEHGAEHSDYFNEHGRWFIRLWGFPDDADTDQRDFAVVETNRGYDVEELG